MSATSTTSAAFPRPARHGERAIHRTSPYHKAARALVILTLLAAPWPYGSVSPWAWAGLSGLVFLSLLLWLTGCSRKGTLRVIWTPLYYPLLLFLALACVQFFGRMTLDQDGARESLLKLVADIVLFFLAGQLLSAQPENSRSLVRFGFIVTVYALLVSSFAVMQFLTSPNVRYIYWTLRTQGWVFGPYINHNHYGGLMEMLIPIAITYVLSRPSYDPRRYLLAGLILVPVISILLSGSRGACFTLITEGLILGGVVLAKSPRSSSKKLAVWATVGVTAAGALFLWLDSGPAASRVASMVVHNKYVEAEVSDRLAVAKDSLRIVRAHPWLGVGVGSYENALPQYQTFTSDVVWNHAHNDYVEALAETGLLGGLLIAAALILFLREAFRHLRERLGHESGWIRMGAAVSCCGLLVHSFLDFNFHLPANAAWFMVCAAIAVHPRVPRKNVKEFTPTLEERGSPPPIP